jgi:hypothetical protein
MEVKRIFIVAFICALLLVLPLPASGEQINTTPDSRSTPVEEWSQTFGGSGHDQGNSVAQTSDGGYIIAGQTYSYGAGLRDVWLIKTDADGNEEWSQTFGGTEQDYGYSVAQTSDGGYIIGGLTYSFASYCDFYLIKTDANGNEVWSQTFGGSGANFAYSVAVCSDGGYVILGDTTLGAGGYDAWLIKTDADGIMQWSCTFGTSSDDYGRSVIQTSDGGYAIAGYTRSYGDGSMDVWLIKTDASGAEEWSQVFGGSGAEYGYSVAQTSDGGYVIAAESALDDYWLIKTDASGGEEWDYTFGGSGSDGARSVAVAPDGGYIIAGISYSYGNGDFWLVKTDAIGVEEWAGNFGGSYNDDGALSVAVTLDGGYIATGYTDSYGSGGSDAWLLKLGESGTTVTPGDGNGDGTVNALDITKVERVIVALDAETPGADANGDGNVNAMDITKIEMIIAGLG